MASYCGIAPFYESSGSSVFHKANTSGYSNRRLKGILTQAARSAITHNPTLRQYYLRMKAQGKPYGVILNNVNNKLVHILFSLVLHDCDFELDHEAKRALRAWSKEGNSSLGERPAARGGSSHPDERSPEEKRVLRVKFKKESLRSGSAPRQGVGAPTPTSGPPKRSRPSLRNEKNFAFYLHMNLESTSLPVKIGSLRQYTKAGSLVCTREPAFVFAV